MFLPGSGSLDAPLTSRGIVETQSRLDLLVVLTFFARTAAERNEVAAKAYKRARRDGAREGFRNSHDSDVRIDRSVEGQIFSESVDEHQRIVDVRADDRLLRTRLREAQTSLGVRVQLSSKDRFGEQATKHLTFRVV